jgi:hypothetical protein
MTAKLGQDECSAVHYPKLVETQHEIPSKERAARMIEVNVAYAQCFMTGDFEGMLDHLIEVPVFEMYPQAIRITGREAVLERSKRLFPLASQNDSRTALSHRITASTAGNDVLIHEFSNIYKLADGTSRRCYTVAVIPFVGDKMVGERVYSDQYLGRLREQLLGADFLERPDVTII